MPALLTSIASLSLVHGLASSPRHESALMQTKAPSKFVTCARCKATFEVDEADFATGRQVRCGGTGCPVLSPPFLGSLSESYFKTPINADPRFLFFTFLYETRSRS